MDIDTFAAERDEDLTDLASEYKPAVESALEEETEEDMTAEFVAALTVLFLLTYGEEGGQEAQAQFFLGLFLEAMEAVLPETTPKERREFEDEEDFLQAQAAQVDLISNWFATATLGASTLYAAQSTGNEQTKTWITMRDDEVRDTHAPLDGETQPIDGFFSVKTEPVADMQYPGQPVGPIAAWINCRCVLTIGNLVASGAYDVAMAVEEVVIEEEELDGTEPPVPDEPIAAEDGNQPVYGVAVPEGVESGDKRMFAPGGVSHRDLPLPLTWQRAAIGEHDGEVVVGRLDTLDLRDDGMWHYTGELLTDIPETEEVINLIAQGALRGVSIAGDKGKVSEPTEEEMMQAMESGDMPPTVFEEARISGLTIVQIPAFQESFISLGIDPDLPDPLAAAAEVESFKRGSGWITHPEETKTLHQYWTKGEGAAKIRWGTGGDFTRCTRQLKKYIEPRFLNRTCAQWHHDALGYWPGELGKPGNNPKTALDCDTPECKELAMIAASAAPALTLTAAAPPAVVDATWFADPKFSAPTALVVDKAGRVFGHIAKWGTCHIGIEGQCVTPPTSKSNYANFHLGAVETTDGTMAVGALTLGTGHADLHMSATDTKHHYDHTGTMVANVRAGEDAHGIWVAGALCDGVTEDQRRTLMAAGGISGDWRSIGGSLELVAGLAVNVPGFPVPRPALAASGSMQESLVAAGVVMHEADPSIDAIANAVVEKLEAKQKRTERLAAMAPLTASLRAHRIAKLTQGQR